MGDSVIGLLFYILSCLIVTIFGHARLWEPPARSTMWRKGFPTPVNTNDNELNCGGYENLWIKYNGMCGICGDPYQQHPRDNEAGGKYATGTVSRHYKTGDVVTFSVDVTANHEGYFEFRLCPADDVVTQACLDRYTVPVIGHSDGRYHLKAHENGIIDMKVKLPTGLACDRCLLQWRYRTGNRWNCDQKSGKCGKGLGPQEEFYGCADISILDFRLSMSSLPVSKPVSKVRRVSSRTRKPVIRVVKRPSKNKVIRNKVLNTAVKQMARVKYHKNTIPEAVVRKGKELNNLSGVLWTLLKSLTNNDPSGRNVALVKWDPKSRSYKSNIVYVRPNVRQPGQQGRLSVNNVRSHWPPKQPMIVEATVDKTQTGPFILSEPPFEQEVKKKILPSVFRNLKNVTTCHGTNNFAKVSGIAKWCTVNCKAGNCPSVMCTCSMNIKRTRIETKPVSPRVSPFRPILRSSGKSNDISIVSRRQSKSKSSGLLRCKGNGPYSRDQQIIRWCNSNCNKGFCPKHMCICI
ncbi:uncharacterized protein [Argopecten irradians]|uniref:uncharacterized protein n=1 Tax=Argopecten irradians TaxID=31199 RepID=UPI0037140364